MRKLLWFTVFFAASVLAFVLGAPREMLYILAAAAALCVIASMFLHQRLLKVCALGLCVGILWCAAYETLFLRDLHLADGTERTVVAEAISYCEPTRYGNSVKAKAELGGRNYTALVYYSDDTVSLKPGDSFTCDATVTAAADALDADERMYDRSRGVWLKISARGELDVTAAEKLRLSHLPAHVSYALRQKIGQLFPSQTGGFLSALLTGNKSGLDYAHRQSLSRGGIYHAVAVSGMHVSILLGMVLILTGERRRLGAAIGFPLAIFFVLMTGASASAVRAGCMQALLLFAPLFRRENDPPTSVAAALLFLLILNPWSILSVGLQLSFASVCGILFFARRIFHPVSQTKCFKALSRMRVIGWLVRQMLAAFACSIASSVFAMPLMALYFGTVSIVAPLTNVLVLWAVTFCFAGGLIVCLLGFCSMPAATVLAWVVDKPVRYV
ncbi:MAG: ComEC/Rec2 family competence protein, partial [Oscillospiraceae bacterium]|nr:ComEC/Rec2 family competence protein [Oscillospiraceae bacterium]